MEAISTTVDGACKATGLGKTSIYRLIGEGRIATVKVGRRTLVKLDSLRALLDQAA